MAATKKKAASAGQAKLTGFGFKKKKNETPSDTDGEASATAVDVDQASEDDDDDDGKVVHDKKAPPDQSVLPPISDIGDIFIDMVSQRPQLLEVTKPLNGRKLRVATMCSGTESPLLALDLIRDAMKEKLGATFDLEHVFSCEIEPFKQAYIERNFHPPIIFRDVCELGGPEATTVYGSKVEVPGDVDLLVAGTSCVDYSNLNNEKQDIDGNGESGKTFHGMMDWVSNHRPPLVILENVCSAPWDRVKDKFAQHGYSAEWLRVDTKQYYIPHTRTRVYLFAIDERKSSIPAKWKKLVQDMSRPASASLDAFLLPGDDPRVTNALARLVRDSNDNNRRAAGHIDWGKCENRHHRARTEEELGNKRPLTAWETGGSCKILDFGWAPWAVLQVERVWDLMDISLLRAAYKGVDPSYKTLVWNLSQNVDRTIGSGRLGIAPCLTPSMIPYVTNRGGPITGLEALSLQGLPVNSILFTRETEDQLADLAGNAMSTTVVGACMIAALILGKDFLWKEDEDARMTEVKDDDEIMDVDKAADDLDSHITGEDQLVERELDLSLADVHSFATLLQHAHQSRRLCTCEGRTDMTTKGLQECSDCGATSCVSCGGRPRHSYVPIDMEQHPRLSPADFSNELKRALPMCLALSGIEEALVAIQSDIDAAKQADDDFEERFDPWRQALVEAASGDLRFAGLKRQQIWSAVFNSSTAQLELVLHPTQPEWRLFGKPKPETAANSPVRKLLANPVARFRCDGELFKGVWELALPRTTRFSLSIKGEGELVDSWERQLGLLGKEVKDKMIWAKLRVTVPDEGREALDRDVSGLYALHERCGTAANALHRRVEGEDGRGPGLFFFLDPTRTGEAVDDPFVFSTNHRRYEFGETRPVVAKLDSKWRQNGLEETQEVECVVACRWVKTPALSLKASVAAQAKVSLPTKALEASASTDACKSANAVLVCRVPLSAGAGPEWGVGQWKEVDSIHERSVFQSLSWCLDRVCNLDEHPRSWVTVSSTAALNCECERCAPLAPIVTWMKVGKKVKGIEDPGQAGRYEQALKRRPAAFVTQLKHDGGVGIVRIGINAVSLVHRASARLPALNRDRQKELAYFIDTNYMPAARIELPRFMLLSNKQDDQHTQPPNFKLSLRLEQLRSLTWMVTSEDTAYAERQTFVEEEIAEAVLAPLGWRVQGRAQRPNTVYGGVLADAVGYGKTAITLGLIDCTAHDKPVDTDVRIPGAIKVKATLVIVPPHLTRQWRSEIDKFTGETYNAIVVSTVSNLNKLTIKSVQEADIIVVASNIFKSNIYLENLESFSAGGSLPPGEGRHFNARLDEIAVTRAEQVEKLKANDVEGVLAALKKAKSDEAEAKRRHEEAAQSKRLKGKQYRDAQAAKLAAKTAKAEAKSAPTPLRGPSPKNPNLIMEVVIPTNGSSPSSSRTAASSSPSTSHATATNGKRQRRAATKKTSMMVIDSDDEEEAKTSDASDYQEDEHESEPEAKPSAKRQPARRGRVVDSDESAEETADETDEEEVVAVPVRPKKKTPARPPKKAAKKAASTSASSDIEMDLDDASDSDVPKKGKKGKAAASKGKKRTKKDTEDEEDEDDEDDAPPKKKAKVTKQKKDAKPAVDRMEQKLSDPAVKKKWRSMPAPPFELFHFHRIVLDEYTYVDGKTLTMVTGLKATHRWVLSGTPPIHDFAAVKSIAAHLDVHLGVDDDGEGQSAQVKKRRREQTDVERFHAFREVRTLEWHAHRHETAQRFLNQFVRQNIAEIDEIPWETHDVIVDLPAAERAIYLELEHQLTAQEMTVKRTKKSESDREKRLGVMIGESSSAEEALLKRAATFDLEEDADTAMTTCERIVKNRADQQTECVEDLKHKMRKAVELKAKIGKAEEEYLAQFLGFLRGKGYGDEEADTIARDCWTEVSGESPSKKSAAAAPAAEGKKAKGKGKAKDAGSSAISDLIWELREHTHDMRRVIKELTGRVRSHRYFSAVRDVQRAGDDLSVDCAGCGQTGLKAHEVSLLSSCGHMGCRSCVRNLADKEECVHAASGKCKDSARVSNIVHADTLGADDDVHSGKHYGRKLEMIVDHIKNVIPKDERILVFVQFPDLTKKVAAAFAEHKVKFLEIKGSASMKSKNLEQFQAEGAKERVLLLNVMDESASGANLTCANHAIFISPLLAQSQEIYEACETQAIGRLRRYGQQKKVHIWRFLTRNTKDVEIFEQRSGLKVV
ncbi:hypothetical protein EXIGLDRAFT_833373 [Exidia glandulosa HHB12029]|uniref:Helicase ATP-binding domain-containing protein n=1 Tax=Exidia glandulosa HHB12029 TaxID=1314781 RepID=A0A165KSF1_EXIGL|nr:hypothetical protein EXIGLDRAFT_833373 [Exidia glandulosa HHB12029]